MMLKEKTNDLILDNFFTRPPTADDLEAVVHLINASSLDIEGTKYFTVEEYRNGWETPGFTPQTDCQLVTTLTGQVVGCAEVWNLPPHIRNFARVRVHPDYRGLGIGTYLTRWSEKRARDLIPQAPAGTRVIIQCGHINTYQAARDLLKAEGYKPIRHFLSMKIEMNGSPSLPSWPDGITVRTLAPGRDEAATFRALDEAFKDHWGHVETPFEEGFARFMHSLNNDPDYDPTLCFLAMDGGEIAGVSMCVFKTTAYPDMGWVEDLAVRRPWRRRGIALALLQHSFGELYRRGRRQVGLGVDASNLTGAMRLYEKAGMHPFRQFDTYEKELRPGRDLVTR
jgi:mycothiol synthase